MYKAIFYKNYSLVQACGRYMIFDNKGNEIHRGDIKEYIDELKFAEIMENIPKSQRSGGSFNTGLGCFTSCKFE